MRKKESSDREPKGYSCPNPACAQAFTKPIKATNLGLGIQQAYDACPYCLTEISTDESGIVQQVNRSEESVDEPILEKPSSVSTADEKAEPQQVGCPHHFGYLGERERKDTIPDECMTCGDIVKCMFRIAQS